MISQLKKSLVSITIFLLIASVLIPPTQTVQSATTYEPPTEVSWPPGELGHEPLTERPAREPENFREVAPWRDPKSPLDNSFLDDPTDQQTQFTEPPLFRERFREEELLGWNHMRGGEDLPESQSLINAGESLSAYPVNNRVQGNGWPASTPITLTIGQNSWTKTSNSYGNVYFYLDDYQFDLVGGDYISMTDGTTTITHTVFPVAVTSVDEAADTVSGTTWPENVLEIYGCVDNTCIWLDIVADTTGNWVADFTGQLDISPGTYGNVYQYDYDGNRTSVYWYVPDPYLTAYPVFNWVESFDWPAYTPITLTIGQNSWTKTSDSSGNVFFYLNDYQFDLVSGDYISMTDGTYTITHTVFPVAVTSVDETADTVSGTTWPDNVLEIYGCDDNTCIWLDIVADTTGNWVANFSGQLDLTPGTDGYVLQYDDDGNRTAVSWKVLDPYLAAYPVTNRVNSYDWPAYANVTLTIGGGSWTKTANSGGYVTFYLNDYSVDLVGGHVISMTDGLQTITHTVFPVEVTSVSETADTVNGTTWPYNVLEVNACNGNCVWLDIYSDQNGNWVANFSGQVDISPGAYGYVYQYDNDGNRTAVYWDVPDPYLSAYPFDNQVSSWDWPAYANVTLTIGGGSWTKTANSDGYVYFSLDQYQFDLVGGQVISMTDGIRTITHTVFPVEVTSVNETADTVNGTTLANNALEVYACNGNCVWLDIYSDQNGNWVANFSGQVDLSPGAYGYVYQYDNDENRTSVYWFVPDPYLYAYTVDDRISSYDWPANTPITLTIGQYAWTRTSNSGGSVYFYLDEYQFDLVGGHVISMTDGTHTITHTVFPVVVTSINETSERVSGTTLAGSTLEIYACKGNCVWLDINSNQNGIWVANFSGLVDISAGVYGYVYQYDNDGNRTSVYWYLPDPYLDAWLVDNRISSWDWPAYTDVTLTIGQLSRTKTSNSVGSVSFYLDEYQFDLVGGQSLTMQGGGYTIHFTTHNLAIWDINQFGDYINGTGSPNDEIGVSIYSYLDDANFNIQTTTDSTGYWIMYLNGLFDVKPGISVLVYQSDNNNNYTVIVQEIDPLRLFLPTILR